MRTRENILSEVLDLHREIEERQKQINELYLEAKNTPDEYDDEIKEWSYLKCIKSYAN